MSETRKAMDLGELGSTGLKRAGGFVYEEFLPNLRNRRGALIYREMGDNDPVIGAYLFAIEKVITRLQWRVDAADENDPQAVEYAEFVESCLHDMNEPWDAVQSNILSMLIYGWSYHEIVYKVRGGDSNDPKRRSRHNDGKIGWRKWPVRAQDTLWQWVFDDDGGIQAMIQMDPSQGGQHIIPIDKALLFRTTTNKGNPEGRSLLRNAYRPWYFKKRIEEIEAVGIERDLAGLPVAFVPPEFLSDNATSAQRSVLASVVNIVQNIKRNEQEGVVFPLVYDEQGHKVFDLTLLSTGGTRQFDTDKVISRYDQRIAMSVLSDFLLLGHERVGSFALGTSKMDLWTMAVDAIAKSISEVINSHAIPRLLRLNGMDPEFAPSIAYGEVSHVDLTEIADFVSKLTASGIITPDTTLEEYLRDVAGLPPAENEHDTQSTALPQLPPTQPPVPEMPAPDEALDDPALPAQ